MEGRLWSTLCCFWVDVRLPLYRSFPVFKSQVSASLLREGHTGMGGGAPTRTRAQKPSAQWSAETHPPTHTHKGIIECVCGWLRSLLMHVLVSLRARVSVRARAGWRVCAAPRLRVGEDAVG